GGEFAGGSRRRAEQRDRPHQGGPGEREEKTVGVHQSRRISAGRTCEGTEVSAAPEAKPGPTAFPPDPSPNPAGPFTEPSSPPSTAARPPRRARALLRVPPGRRNGNGPHRVRLPPGRCWPRTPAHATLPAPALPRMEATLKILFVDDEPDLAPLIRQKFRRHVREGLLALDFASDGVEALEKLDQHPDIELVVTDLNLPRMDGLTLLRHLREREREHKAIVVTAYGDMENIRTAMNQGAFDFLTKPIDLGDLEVTINNARELVEREREASVVRQAFGRYLSDKIAQAILSDPGALSLGGERREVSVLMSDLSGFSALSERLEPERVVELLNLYLGKMTEVIDAYDGTIDE